MESEQDTINFSEIEEQKKQEGSNGPQINRVKPKIFSQLPIIRLSESFPPTSTANQDFISPIHKLLLKFNLELLDLKQKIRFREVICKRDVLQLELLHREWFPIKYGDEFYKQIFEGQAKCLLMELQLDIDNKEQEIVVNQLIAENEAVFYKNKADTTYGKKQSTDRGNIKIIVGAVTYVYRQAESQFLKFSLREWLFRDRISIYIMTIGVINELRGKGQCGLLLDKLKDIAYANQDIHYIFLHMVEYNNAGEKLYKKNNFKKVQFLKDHYEIEGGMYNAYLFIFYCKQNNVKNNPSGGLIARARNMASRIVQYPNGLLNYLCARRNQAIQLGKQDSEQQ